MTDTICIAAAGMGAAIFLLGLLLALLPEPRRFCPGPRRGLLRGLISPRGWFVRGCCGYDMTGHLGERFDVSSITCPECGREMTRARHLLKRPRGLRLVTSAASLSVLFLTIAVHRFFTLPHWDDHLPSTALLFMERIRGDSMPTGARAEIRERWRDGEFDDWQERMLMPMLVRDLRADEKQYNADHAKTTLLAIEDFDLVRGALHDALQSENWQQRQMAGEILRERGEPLDADLLEVTLEALRVDRSWSSNAVERRNASAAFVYLREHPRGREVFRRCLGSDDAQQRIFAARGLWELDEPPTPRLLNVTLSDFGSNTDIEYEAGWILLEGSLLVFATYCMAHRDVVVPFLRELLQQDSPSPSPTRALAASLLRHMGEPADANLLDALVDALRYDKSINRELHTFIVLDSVAYLSALGVRATEALREGMASDDLQQRLLCAAIAGFAEIDDLADDAAPILIEHLKDNRVSDDALFAARAVFGLGPQARPWLEVATRADNQQIAEMALYLLRRMDDATATFETPRWRGAKVTLAIDPAGSDWRDLDLPRIDPARDLGWNDF